MDTFEQALALMRAAGEGLGAQLEPDETGACGLLIDDRLEVTLRYEPTPPAVLLYCPVGELPQQRVAAALRHLLEANHLWEGGRGATWSLAGGEAVLSRLLPLEGLETQVLLAELASFVDVALEAGQLLAEPADATDTTDTTDTEPSAGKLPEMLPSNAITA